MAKFVGDIGFAQTEKTSPGVYEEVFVKRTYYGDFVRKGGSVQETENLNGDIRFSNMISIVADEYLIKHFSQIRYVTWMGADWEVSSVEVNRPRLILYFGGVYNGTKA